MIELNVAAIARKGMNGMIMRRRKTVGESKNQKKRKVVAKNWIIYDTIRKGKERKARAYFVKAFLVSESGGIGFEHPTEKRDGEGTDGEEDERKEEDADWDDYEQGIESNEGKCTLRPYPLSASDVSASMRKII